MESAAVILEVRDHVGRRDFQVVHDGVLQVLVPRLVNNVTKEIDNSIVGDVGEDTVVAVGRVFRLRLVDYGVWCVFGDICFK